MSARREISGYVRDAFYTYEAMRDARDEALTRCQELEDQRDQAWRVAAALEAEVAKVRRLHRPDLTNEHDGAVCFRCSTKLTWTPWPCPTAEAVYL